MIKINDKNVGVCSVSCHNTDLSKVTARPEFVLKGKTFYDETGQLRVGTAEFVTIAAETAETN